MLNYVYSLFTFNLYRLVNFNSFATILAVVMTDNTIARCREVRGYQFSESVSYPYPQRTIRIRIRTFLQIDIRIRSVSVTIVFHVFKVYGHDRSKLNVKRLPLVASYKTLTPTWRKRVLTNHVHRPSINMYK